MPSPQTLSRKLPAPVNAPFIPCPGSALKLSPLPKILPNLSHIINDSGINTVHPAIIVVVIVTLIPLLSIIEKIPSIEAPGVNIIEI